MDRPIYRITEEESWVEDRGRTIREEHREGSHRAGLVGARGGNPKQGGSMSGTEARRKRCLHSPSEPRRNLGAILPCSSPQVNGLFIPLTITHFSQCPHHCLVLNEHFPNYKIRSPDLILPVHPNHPSH